MDDSTLARLRPRDRSSGAIEDALAVIHAEQGHCNQRVAVARNERLVALVRASTAGLDRADRSLRDAERDAEMLDALECDLQAKLTQARQGEARRHEAMHAAVAQAEAAVAAYTAKAAGYAKHAAAIAEICRLDQAAALAVQQVHALARASRMPLARLGDRPAVSTGPLSGMALSDTVVLPVLSGGAGETYWGTLPREHLVQSVYAHPDAPRVVV